MLKTMKFIQSFGGTLKGQICEKEDPRCAKIVTLKKFWVHH